MQRHRRHLVLTIAAAIVAAPGSMAAAQGSPICSAEDLTDNEAVVCRYYDEIVNGDDWSRASEVVAEAFVQNSEGVAQGRDGVLREMRANRERFADFVIRLDEMIAEDDLVMVRATVSGRHADELLGVPATDRSVSFASMDVFRVRDGQLVEHWDVTDRLALLQQIGATEVPPAPDDDAQ